MAENPNEAHAEPAAEGGPAPEAAEPAEALHPKERRRRARARHDGAAAPTRTPEERQAERAARRRAKAVARRRRRPRDRAKARERAAARRAAQEGAPALHAEVGAGRPKIRQGVVVSDRADKTITVRIDIVRRHRRYQKVVRTSATLHVHDERNEAHAGDTVRVVECRPRSATKRWRLVDVLERAR